LSAVSFHGSASVDKAIESRCSRWNF